MQGKLDCPISIPSLEKGEASEVSRVMNGLRKMSVRPVLSQGCRDRVDLRDGAGGQKGRTKTGFE